VLPPNASLCMGATDSAKCETHTHGCLISTRTNVQIPLLRIISVHVDVHIRASQQLHARNLMQHNFDCWESWNFAIIICKQGVCMF
jgi:hypothetical protein